MSEAPVEPVSPAPPAQPDRSPGWRERLGVDLVSRANRVMLTASLLSCLLLALAAGLPVPYAVLSPGPATNTLGSAGGTPLITISGQTTYPTSGALDLTTVVVEGGPSRVSLLTVVQAWLDAGMSVYPAERVFPPGQTEEQNEEENQLEMASSQQSATAAALRTLGYEVPETMRVSQFQPGSPAAGQLEVGDEIVAVGGVAVSGGDTLRAELQKVPPGRPAPMAVVRDGRQLEVAPLTRAGENGATLLGILVEPTFELPFEVKITIDNVGGPSAGTMFALGIIDKLTPGELTGGRTVAGTGTITPDGQVGPIGGIRQKLIGARRAGATVFLAPADNCPEVVGHVPDGLSVIKVTTLDQAYADLRRLNDGAAPSSLPSCG